MTADLAETSARAWSALLAAARAPTAGALDLPAHPLVERYGPLALAGPRTVAGQMGQSLDGCIASRTGDGDCVTGPEDHEHLHRLRALCDAVLVGVGTVVADDPRLTVRHVPGHPGRPQPTRVVLDPRGRAPAERAVFRDGAAPTLWVVGEAADVTPPVGATGVEVLRLPCPEAGFAEAAVVTLLAARGLGRLLVEGGGVTVSRFLAAGLLDRLYVTVTPLLVGDGRPGLRFDGPDRLSDALRPASRCFPLGADVLFELTLG